jgi:hypothetical protein
MDRRLAPISALVITAIITVLALTWGFRYDWPDYVHDSYGVPLTWGIHTLNTIQGPADIWRVDIMALFLDLALWMVIMVISQIILQMSLKKRGA